MAGVPHRCAGKLPDGSRCLRRFTFKHRWDTYKERYRKRCDRCGSKWFWVEQHRLKRLDVQKGCGCDGYPYPHRPGCLWCVHRSRLLRPPDPEDYALRFGGAPEDYE